MGGRDSLKKVQKVNRAIMASNHWAKALSNGKLPTPPMSLDQTEQTTNDPDMESVYSAVPESASSIHSDETTHLARSSHKRKHTRRHNEVEESTAKRQAIKDREKSPDSLSQSSPLAPGSGI